MAKILVIDDDQDIANTTAALLKAGGHTVEIELDDQKALQHYTRTQPDLIVLDVMFPNNPTAGFELARSLRQDGRKTPILMVTSSNEHSSMKVSNKDRDDTWMPVNEFVEKPIRKDVLLDHVTRLTGKS